MKQETKHETVLCRETVDLVMENHRHGDYLDATFGLGGHSRRLLARLDASSRLLAVDRDEDAVACAETMAATDGRVIVRRGSFGDIDGLLTAAGFGRLQGAIMDLGISSAQLDAPERGFSFLADGPLDMRMDRRQALTAAGWLNEASVEDLTRVLREYGEERHARRIGRAIVAARPLSTTGELVRVVAAARPERRRRIHEATRVFQAIRIFVNRELDELARGIEGIFARLAVGGRLAVISFHSLEDRIVKRYFRARSSPPQLPREIPVRDRERRVEARIVAGPLRAGRVETLRNPRARSAVLRVLERAA